MEVALVYDRESQTVIKLFGQPNREKYGLATIRRIVIVLKRGGHQVRAFEGDKNLIDRLEEFMARTLVGEWSGMAFNLSYGRQGQARYTYVPGILKKWWAKWWVGEMVGVPKSSRNRNCGNRNGGCPQMVRRNRCSNGASPNGAIPKWWQMVSKWCLKWWVSPNGGCAQMVGVHNWCL
jgi:hypothetical protein